MSAEPDTESLTRRLVGTTIDGKYRVEALLGEGGMGAVFRVRHLGLRRDLALKVLRPELTSHAEIAARFDREAHSAARLDHPNCLQVTDFGTTEDGLKYMVMQLLSGRELAHLLEEGPQPPSRAVELTIQILRGLEHAHEQGVVHRDLKPENVLITTDHDGRELLKLVDFGIAKLLEGETADGEVDGSPKLTRVGMVFGTPTYMSPEQAAGGEVDHRADLYSVGIMLYQMLAGDVPFRSDDLVKVLRLQIASPPPPLPDSVPAGLQAVVGRLLEKERKDRYDSATEVIAALRSVDAASAVSASGAAASASIGTGTLPPVAGSSSSVTPVPSLPGLDPSLSASAHAPTSMLPTGVGLSSSTVAPVSLPTIAPLSFRPAPRKWSTNRIVSTAAAVLVGLALLGLITRGDDDSENKSDEVAVAGVPGLESLLPGPVEAAPLPFIDPLDTSVLAEVDEAILAARLDVADVKLTALEDEHPEHPRLRWRRARLLAARKQGEAALQAYGEIAQATPELLDEADFAAELSALMQRKDLRATAVDVAAARMGHAGHAFLLARLNDVEDPLSLTLRRRARQVVEGHPECAALIDARRQVAQDLLQAGDAEAPCEVFEHALHTIEGDLDLVYLQPVHDAKLPRKCRELKPLHDKVKAKLAEAHGPAKKTPGKSSGRCRGLRGVFNSGC